MIVEYKKKLEKLISEQNGTVLTTQLDSIGIPRIYLQILIDEGKLERVNRGVYVSTDAIEDKMLSMQLKYPKIIYSHETSLYMHNLTDRTPSRYSVTVPSGYKASSNMYDQFKFFYIRKDLVELGVESMKSPNGNFIKIYNIERTICDLIRSRNRIDIQILNEALKQFVKMKTTDYSILMSFAKELKIDTILSKYLEILL